MALNYKDTFFSLRKLFEGTQGNEDKKQEFESPIIRQNGGIGWVKIEMDTSRKMDKDWFCRHTLSLKISVTKKLFMFDTKEEFQKALREAKEEFRRTKVNKHVDNAQP